MRDRTMAATVLVSRRRAHGHGCLLRLVAAAAVVAAFVLGAARAQASGSSGGDRVLLNVESLFPDPSSCATPQEHKPSAATSARMKIVHRHGPCSPLADAHRKPPSHAEILAADQDRVESIQHRVSATTTGELTKRAAPVTVKPGPKKSPGHSPSSSSTPSLPASSGSALSTGNYVVTIGLGTPAGVAADGGVRHRQRHDVGAVPPLRGQVLQAEAAALRPGQVVHLRQHLLRGPRLRRPRRERLQRRALPVRRPVRRRLLHRRLLRPRHPHRLPRRHQGVPVRVRGEEQRPVREGGGAHGARPREDVADGAGVQQVRRRVRVLPPGVVVGDDGVPGLRPRRGAGQREGDADADRQRGDVLLRGPDGHPRGRAAGVYPGVHLLHGRDAGGLWHCYHAAPGDRQRRAVVGVRCGHGFARVQKGAGVLDPGHLLRLHGGQRGGTAGGVAGVPGRRVPGRGRVRDHVPGLTVAGVPGVCVQRRRQQRRHHREHAAEDPRRALRPRQEDRRLRPRCLLIDHLILARGDYWIIELRSPIPSK